MYLPSAATPIIAAPASSQRLCPGARVAGCLYLMSIIAAPYWSACAGSPRDQLGFRGADHAANCTFWISDQGWFVADLETSHKPSHHQRRRDADQVNPKLLWSVCVLLIVKPHISVKTPEQQDQLTDNQFISLCYLRDGVSLISRQARRALCACTIRVPDFTGQRVTRSPRLSGAVVAIPWRDQHRRHLQPMVSLLSSTRAGRSQRRTRPTRRIG